MYATSTILYDHRLSNAGQSLLRPRARKCFDFRENTCLVSNFHVRLSPYVVRSLLDFNQGADAAE